MNLIGLLVMIIVIGVVIWAVRALTAAFSIPQPIATVIYVLVVLVCLVYVLSSFGLVGSGPILRLR